MNEASLSYELFEDGKKTDAYDSFPNYGDLDIPNQPEGGDVDRLCLAFGVDQNRNKVERVLHPSSDTMFFASEHDRHIALAALLGIPSWRCALNYGVIGEIKSGRFSQRNYYAPKNMNMADVIEITDARLQA